MNVYIIEKINKLGLSFPKFNTACPSKYGSAVQISPIPKYLNILKLAHDSLTPRSPAWILHYSIILLINPNIIEIHDFVKPGPGLKSLSKVWTKSEL